MHCRLLLGVAEPEQRGPVSGLERAARLRGRRDGAAGREQVGAGAQGERTLTRVHIPVELNTHLHLHIARALTHSTHLLYSTV